MQDLGIENTLDIDLFSKIVLQNQFDILDVIDSSQTSFQSEIDDSLLSKVGSRRYCWMLFLGLIPAQGSHIKQIEQLLAYRNLYYKKIGAVRQFKV